MLPDQRNFRIESMSWLDIHDDIEELPARQRADGSDPAERTVSLARSGPERPVGPARSRPMAMASKAYEPLGLVLGFHYNSSPAISHHFRLRNDLLHSQFLLQWDPVFTSKDDDTFGQIIDIQPNDPNDSDSDGDPRNNQAAQAILVYRAMQLNLVLFLPQVASATPI